MNFLQNLWSGAQDLWSNLFGKQQIVSPLPTPQQTGLVDQFGQPVPIPRFDTSPQVAYNPNVPNNPGISTSSGMGALTSPSGAQPPPYAPNTKNQTVSYGGATWKGNPGTGWTLQDGGGTGESFADQILQAVADPLQAEIESWWKRLDEYDKNNPFAFDEALAKASSQERLNPYYDATMNEFMQGIRASSTRSVENMTRTIGELNVDASKLSEKERLNTQEAIRASEEGFAGSGLFFSGKRQRGTGLQEVSGIQTQEGIQTNLERGLATSARSNTRLQEDLALQKARQTRLTEAERTTALETDIAKQKKEAEMQRALEQAQFAGSGTNLSTSQRMQLENQFLSGLTEEVAHH